MLQTSKLGRTLCPEPTTDVFKQIAFVPHLCRVSAFHFLSPPSPTPSDTQHDVLYPAGFVNVNVALEMDEVSSEVTALILSIVGAAFVSSIVAVVFYDQAYMAAVVWAIAGIAAKQAYRRERLGKPVADGVDDALQGLWIALILVGVMGIFATVRARNKNFAENEEDKRYSVRASGADNSRTPALFSS